MPPVLSHVTEKYLTRFDGLLRELIGSLQSLPPRMGFPRLYLLQLLPLHRTAGEMCRNLLLYTTCLPLQEQAESLLAASLKSAPLLEGMESRCISGSEALLMRYARRSRQVLDTAVYRMGSAHISNNLNANFMKQMLPLQEGLREISLTALGLGLSDPVKGEAEKQAAEAEKVMTVLKTLLGAAEGW